MPECKNCKYAVWDYCEYSPCGRQYFVCDCELDNDPEDCKYFEEEENGEE